jgi:hypothetical protein
VRPREWTVKAHALVPLGDLAATTARLAPGTEAYDRASSVDRFVDRVTGLSQRRACYQCDYPCYPCS